MHPSCYIVRGKNWNVLMLYVNMNDCYQIMSSKRSLSASSSEEQIDITTLTI